VEAVSHGVELPPMQVPGQKENVEPEPVALSLKKNLDDQPRLAKGHKTLERAARLQEQFDDSMDGVQETRDNLRTDTEWLKEKVKAQGEENNRRSKELHELKVESIKRSIRDSQREPGSKGNLDFQKANENEEEEQRAEQPSGGQEQLKTEKIAPEIEETTNEGGTARQFDPRMWDKGDRGKAAAIVLSCSRAGLRGGNIAPFLDRAKIKPTSKNSRIVTQKQWSKSAPANFYKYLEKLRRLGEKLKEETGIGPDDGREVPYYKSYGK